MTWKLKLLKNFPFGIFLGSLLGISVCWMVLGHPVVASLVQFPTLITGLIAIGAAAIALTGNLSTIENQNRISEDSRLGKMAASRAVLPLALSEIISVCHNRVAFAINGEHSGKDAEFFLSGETQKTLKECIEFSSGGARDLLVEIIQIYQVLLARSDPGPHMDIGPSKTYFEIASDSYGKSYRFSLIVDWLTLNMIVRLVFNYARGVSANVARVDVQSEVLRHLDFVSDRSGYCLTNAPTFQKLLDSYKRGRSFYFALPNWREKWKAT